MKKRAFTDSSPHKSTKKTKHSELGPILGDITSWDDHDNVDSPPYDVGYYAYSPCLEDSIYSTHDQRDPEMECAEADHRLQNLECAHKALEYYNKKNRANFELVDEALNSNGFLTNGIWIHCNFMAKQKNTSNGTKLFFAELLYPRARPFSLEVGYCCILKGKPVVGCGSCDGDLMHPPYGFRGGLKRYCSYALRSRSQQQQKNKEMKKRAFTDSSPHKSTKKTKHLELGPILGDITSWGDHDNVDSPPYDVGYYPHSPCLEDSIYSTHDQRDPEMECAEADHRLQNLECAHKALEYYNKKNRANFELVDEALNSNGFLTNGIWIHCNFMAKQKNTSNGTKLFFAELLYPRTRPFSLEVGYCCILKGKPVVGCGSCEGDLMHPPYGFRAGLKRYRSYALRSRSRT